MVPQPESVEIYAQERFPPAPVVPYKYPSLPNTGAAHGLAPSVAWLNECIGVTVGPVTTVTVEVAVCVLFAVLVAIT